MALGRYTEVARAANGDIVRAGEVLVFHAGTSTLAALYADDAGTVPQGNPVLTDYATGAWSVVVEAGVYDLGYPDGSVVHGVPVAGAAGTAVESSQLQATAPLAWDSSSTTVSVDTDEAGGVPVLDASGLIKLGQMPISGLNYQGAWDASANSPTLADGTGTAGDLYRVSVAGSQDLGSGSQEYAVGDHVVYEGTTWQRFDAPQVIAWGDITGTLSNQADLQSALDAKLDLSGGTMTGPIHMGEKKINNLGDAASARDAVNKQQLDGKLPTAGGTMSGGLKFGQETASDPTETSRHISLWGDGGAGDGSYGFSVTSYTMNLVAGPDEDQDKFAFYKGSDRMGVIQDPIAAPEALTTKQYVDQAVAGVGGGHLTVASHAPTGDITLAATDPTVQLVDASSRGQALIVTLPASPTTGKVFTVKKVDSSASTVNLEPGSATINGQGGAEIAAQNSFLSIVFDGTNWQVIAAFNP